MHSERLRVWIVASLALAACGAGTTDDGPEVLHLRPGVHRVYQGRRANDPTCGAESPGACPTFEAVTVTDVDVDGPHMAVLRLNQRIDASLDLSDDSGVTWRHVHVAPELGVDVIWNNFDVGVHLEGGKVYLVLSRNLDAHQGEWAFHEVLEPSGQLLELPNPGPIRPFSDAVRRPDRHWRAMASLGAQVPSMEDFDVITGERTEEFFQCSQEACQGERYVSSDVGASFDAYSHPSGNRVCRFHWSEADGPAQFCVPRAAWPAPDVSNRTHILHRGHTPYAAWSTDGQVWATPILDGPSPTVGETLPLGPGELAPFRIGGTGMARFGAFESILPLGDATEGRFVALHDDGPVTVSFRATACADEAASCGYAGFTDFGHGQIQWVQPTGDGDFWVFYGAQTEAHDNQQALYLGRETPTYTPIIATGTAPEGADIDTSGIARVPTDAHLMTVLEQACAHYASCVGEDTSARFDACISHYGYPTGAQPGIAAAVARFVGASSCAGLEAAWPEGFALSSSCPSLCLEAGGTCPDGTCDIALPDSTPSMCGTCQDGAFMACFDGHVYPTPCGSNGQCVAGHGCGYAGSCELGPRCTDNYHTTWCDAETGWSGIADCAAIGGYCEPAVGCVGGTATSQAACDPGSYGLWCDWPFLIACPNRITDVVDCRTLGYAGCGFGPGGAHCE